MSNSAPEDRAVVLDNQRARAARSLAILKEKLIPALPYHFEVAEASASLRDSAEIVTRLRCLWIITYVAEGGDRHEVLEVIQDEQLWDDFSPDEKKFLRSEPFDEEAAQALVWRYESIWVLAWVLKFVEELGFPGGMCDMPQLETLLEELAIKQFRSTVRHLRGCAEVLDEKDLTLRIHWACREAVLRQDGKVPADLDWSGDSPRIPVEECAAALVVQERHHVLNWLLNSPPSKNWDEVSTPT